jgi:hypothetical protein
LISPNFGRVKIPWKNCDEMAQSSVKINTYPALSDALAIARNQESVQQFTAMTLSRLMLGSSCR